MKTDKNIYINLLLFTYERAGAISLIRLLGFSVYQRVGSKIKLFFWVLKAKND